MISIAVEFDEQTKRYILHFDASLYNESNCLRKVYFKLIRGIGHGDKDFKIEYGTAFHKALQVYYSGGRVEECVNAAFNHYSQSDIMIPENDWRSLAHLVNCVQQYVKHYNGSDLIKPLQLEDGSFALERRFSYPLFKTKHVEILLSGTIDFIGTFASQYSCFVDHKTTSLTNVDGYLNGYVLSPQLMLYKFMHDKLFGGDIACLINGIFLNRTNKNTFKRSSLITFSKQQIKSFEWHLMDTIYEIVNRFEHLLLGNDNDVERLFPQNFTCCNEIYGLCEYAPLCMTQEDADKEMLIELNYTKRQYNPLTHQT